MVLVLFCVLMPLVLGTGIHPAKTQVDARNLLTYDGTFWVLNNEHRVFSAELFVGGQMGDHIKLKQEKLNFREDDESLPVDFTITFPDTVPPGESVATILVEEFAPEGSGINTRFVLKHKIYIQGEYPEKYVIPKLNFHEGSFFVEFISEVKNFGDVPIEKLSTTFYVNDKQQNLQEIETSVTPLNSEENRILKAQLPKDLFDVGEYEVSAVTKYDGQQTEITKRMIVGSPSVDITYFNKFLQAGKINKYELELQNNWNQKLQNVYVDVAVKRDGQQIDTFQTRSIDLGALLRDRITDYYDATSKDAGSYAFDMVVNFWNTYKMGKQGFTVELIEGEVPETSPVQQEPEAKNWLVWVLFGALGVCLLVGLALVIAWARNREEEF